MSSAFVRSVPLRRSLNGLALIGLLTVAVFFTTSCERRPAKLRWKLEPGKTYVYRSEVAGNWRIEGWEKGERGGEFGNLIETEMSVLGIGSDSAFRIREAINLIREGQEFEPTIVTYSMAPDGRLYGMSEVGIGSAPRSIPSRERREYRKQYFEQTQPTYPDRELKPGETWVQETKVVLDDRVITTMNQFDVKGWEKVGSYLCLRIDYQGESFVPYESEGRNLLEHGKVRGSIWFAPQEGLPVQQRDSFYVSTARIVPEGENPPSTYVVQSVRLYQLVEIR
ncbi:hypothetical protein KAX21_05200 [candidate division WOR-3 bacterium]|nr:hypothetical protein [candidate division WOR-3 bacterium]